TPILERRVQLPQGTLGGRLTVGQHPLKLPVRVRLLPPEPCEKKECPKKRMTRGSANGRPPGSDPGCGGSTPFPRTRAASRKPVIRVPWEHQRQGSIPWTPTDTFVGRICNPSGRGTDYKSVLQKTGLWCWEHRRVSKTLAVGFDS